jgi:hypothetical protein
MATTKTSGESGVLASTAQAKAKPASRITPANIERVQAALKGEAPSERVGIGLNVLAQLASGKKSKGALRDEQFIALRDLGRALGRDTFYGRKLAGMLWAIEKGAHRNGSES